METLKEHDSQLLYPGKVSTIVKGKGIIIHDLSLFYEASTLVTPKPGKYKTTKTKLQIDIPDEHRCKNLQ